MATLLEIAQQIAESVGLPAPSSIQGNTNQDALRLKSSINEAGQWLARKPWPAMVADATIVGVSTQSEYPLPSDFGGIVPDTFWDTTGRWKATGAITPQRYEAIRHGFAKIAIFSEYRIRASTSVAKIFIQPAPSSTQTFIYRYRRTHWVLNSAGVSTEPLWNSNAGDNAVPLIDGHALMLEARWRFLRKLMQPYAEEKQEARDYALMAMADARGASMLNAGLAPKRTDTGVVAVTPESSIAG